MRSINNGNVRNDPWVASGSSLRGWGNKPSKIKTLAFRSKNLQLARVVLTFVLFVEENPQYHS